MSRDLVMDDGEMELADHQMGRCGEDGECRYCVEEEDDAIKSQGGNA